LNNEGFRDMCLEKIIWMIKKNEMGGTCGTYTGHTGLWWGILRETDYLEDLDVDGRTILKWI
jgi:hypothetical protein